jgi:hypothetical protein
MWYENIRIENWYKSTSGFLGILDYNHIIELTEISLNLYLLEWSNGTEPDKRRHMIRFGNLVYREYDRFYDKKLYKIVVSCPSIPIDYMIIELRDKKIEEIFK